MKNRFGLRCAGLLALLLSGCASRPLDFLELPKIDVHVHLDTADTSFAAFAAQQGFGLVTLVTGGSDSIRTKQEIRWAQVQRERCANVAYAVTFSLQDRDLPGWAERVCGRLEEDFAAGAIGVKVWKEIGMTFRKPGGPFLMIDDPVFDPILDRIARDKRTLFAHIAEPINCWLPLDSMSVNNDRAYFRDHPEYHMFLHPDYPSHGELIASRDRMLEKHPGLKVVGAHLGSLEWDVDVLARCLDRHPNLAVDLAARMGHLQVQDPRKVRWFLTAYQDRVLYGTDLIVEENAAAAVQAEYALRTWKTDWKYLATDDTSTSEAVNGPFRGLRLPPGILKKIYQKNALEWIPALRNGKPFPRPVS
jgi:hypothetical protein